MSAPIWWLLALPFVAGACLPLQAGINGQLAKQVSSVLAASLVSFAVGTLALLLLVLAQREFPSLGALKGLTWWHWSGGLLGVMFCHRRLCRAQGRRTAVYGVGDCRATEHGPDAGSFWLGRLS